MEFVSLEIACQGCACVNQLWSGWGAAGARQRKTGVCRCWILGQTRGNQVLVEHSDDQWEPDVMELSSSTKLSGLWVPAAMIDLQLVPNAGN
jgi:hypothetical protein